ncbi:MAG: hypothetical protein QM727_03340 [Niabella sp.]
MRRIILTITALYFCSAVFAQHKWFSLYIDSTRLVNDANEIGSLFIADINKIKPGINFHPPIILHTTPWLIYYDGKVNLPLWEQVIPELKSFTYNVSGGEKNGKKLFGLFFNGFYLPHELGHGFQDKTGKNGLSGSYDNEYFANTVATLWWRKHNKQKELKQCYRLVKKVLKHYSNPVPPGVDIRKYYTDNYQKILADKENFAQVYGYMQFMQFIKIYEDKSLPGFDDFIKNFLNKQQ